MSTDGAVGRLGWKIRKKSDWGFNLRLCDDFQPLSFGIMTYLTRRIEEHGCAGLGCVWRPIRQAIVIGISCPCEVHPGLTQLFTEDERVRIACAVVIADFGVVKSE